MHTKSTFITLFITGILTILFIAVIALAGIHFILKPENITSSVNSISENMSDEIEETTEETTYPTVEYPEINRNNHLRQRHVPPCRPQKGRVHYR